MISPDRDDLAFQLFDMLPGAALCEEPYFENWDRSAIEAVLETAERIATEHFLPHAAYMDENEPRFVDGRVAMSDAVGEALAVYRDAGFFGAGFDETWGGAQMPQTVRSAVSFIFSMANIGTSGYPFLTIGAANLGLQDLALGFGDMARLGRLAPLGHAQGQRVVDRNLGIQPTIRVRPGWPVRVVVTRDIVFR